MGPVAASQDSGPGDERSLHSPPAAGPPATLLSAPGCVCPPTRSTGVGGPGAPPQDLCLPPHLPHKEPPSWRKLLSCFGDLKLFGFQNKEHKAPLMAISMQ